MAKQIKKKFIADNAIDGVKLLLEKDQTLRRLLENGSEQDVIAHLEGLVGAEEARALIAEGSLQTALSAEVSARQSAVSAEVSARIAGDSSLQTALSAEVSARQSAVSAEESARIAAVSAEESARQSADASLQTALSDEESARIAAVSAEESARQSADASLQSQIDFIVSNTDESALDSLSEIVAAYQTADGDILASISTLQSTHDSELSAEESARIAGDASLQSNISAEESARIAADSSLQTAVSAEESARQSADADLQSKLDVEIVRARISEENLQSNISAEESARIAADSSLESVVSAEQSRAEGQEAAIRSEFAAADSTLQSTLQANIDAEEQSRIDGDNALDGRLSPIEGMLEYKYTTVSNSILAVYADAMPGKEDANLREGWYYTNDGVPYLNYLGQAGSNKINWYFHDGSQDVVTLADFSGYAVMTFDDNSESPIMAVYTMPFDSDPTAYGTNPDTGVQDAGTWYHSKVTYNGFSSTPEVGKKYVVYFGQEPEIHPELPRLELLLSVGENTVGEQLDTEIVMTSSFGSNSSAPTGSVKFMVESLGVHSPEHKTNVKLKIHHATQEEFDALQAQVNDLDAGYVSEQELTDAVSSLQADIDQNEADADAAISVEASTRLAADQSLSSDISAEESARIAGDASLQSQINDIISNVDPSALDSLSEIVDAFQSADGDLQAAITSALGTHTSELNTEVSARQSADSSLETALSAEESARQSADASLQSDISAEESARQSADSSLEAAISVEASTRLAADQSLSSDISAEVSARQSADASLQTALSDEVSARQSADSSLQTALNGEESARQSADAILQSQIDSIESGLVQFGKESFTITQTDIDNEYIDLAFEAKPNSIVMFVDRLAMHEGAADSVCDYSVSVVGGVTRVTFESEMLTPAAEALEVGQVIRVTYAK